MKSLKDPRHLKREKIMRELFEWEFNHQAELTLDDSQEIIKQIPELNKSIIECAPTWPIEKINKIDLAILRLAIFELSLHQVPPKVVVDEAVELAKSYSSESSPSFINGVLGNYIETIAKTSKA